MKLTKCVGLGCLLGVMLAFPVSAKDKDSRGKGKSHSGQDWKADSRQGPGDQGRERRDKWTFTDDERHEIRSYVDRSGQWQGKHSGRLPPGLAKKVHRGRDLPPGWEKRCVPGAIMPPEVYRECRPLPREIAVKLPPPPEPIITVAVDGRVVRLVKATMEILDVFDVHVRL